jgi:Alpha galactosidase C-terminal beta sandwich domain/Ricin-type beta-trefoil lectin domain
VSVLWQGTITSRAFASQGGVLDAFNCGTSDGTSIIVYPNDDGSGTCGGKNQQWTWDQTTGTIHNVNSGTCLDVYDFTGPVVDLWSCNGGVNQAFTLSTDGTISTAAGSGHPSLCLRATTSSDMCTNVWGRKLSGGAYALGFVNNAAVAQNITCDAACFGGLNVTGKAYLVRDLWQHADVAKVTAPFSFTAEVAGNGFAGLYKLTPL